MRAELALALLLAAAPALAVQVTVKVCYNWSCDTNVAVIFEETRLAAIGARLTQAADPAEERAALAAAVGELYRIAGEVTPIKHDRAGNWDDQEVDGRMDCIDHSTTTTRFLRLLEARGGLRFHRVMAPERRTSFVIGQHFSAVVEELAVPAASPPRAAIRLASDVARPAPIMKMETVEASVPARYVIDSWFVDHGEPAVVLPLADWLNGDGPNVH